MFKRLLGRKAKPSSAKPAPVTPAPAAAAPTPPPPVPAQSAPPPQTAGELVTVTFDTGQVVEVPWGQSVLDAIAETDLDIDHFCGGMASCGSCRVEVVEGSLAPADELEDTVLEMVREQDSDRLACQALVHGPVTLRVP